jgi:MoxR-like ATPase
MQTSTVPQALALFNNLPHAAKVAIIIDLYAGAPLPFTPADKSSGELEYIVAHWVNAGSIPPGVLALACARAVAAAAIPAAPPAPLAIPVFIPPQPAAVAPQPATVYGLQGGHTVAVEPQPAAVEPQYAPQPALTPVAAAIVTPQPVAFDAAAMPRLRSRVLARSLFGDCPADVVNAIPAALMVEYYAHPAAPAVDPDYAYTGATLAACLGALGASPCFNLWFKGPRATGKTEMARQLAARLGRPFFRFNFNRGTDSEDILGGQAIKGGNTLTELGPVAIGAQTEGAIVLLDEPTYTIAAHVAALNPILERDGAIVRVPRTGELLTIAPGVCFIAADNTGGHGSTSNEYHGRTPFGSDTLDRFGKFVAFDYLPADVERKVLRALVKRACGVKPDTALARSVCKLVAVTRAKADAGELEGAPSLRRAVAFCVALVQGFAPADAYTDCVINAAPEDSQETLRQIFAATWDHGNSKPAQPDANANPFVADDSNAIPF